MAKTPNYSEDDIAFLNANYVQGMDVSVLANKLGRTTRSVIAKLVQMKLYEAPAKAVKTAEDEGPTKKDLLSKLAAMVSFDVSGLENATKASIAGLIETFESYNAEQAAEAA